MLASARLKILSRLITFFILFLLLTFCPGCKEKLVLREDTTPPIILQGPTVTTTDTTATICWVTDEPCSAAVEFCPTSTNQYKRVVSKEFRQNQEILIHSLTPSTQYRFITYSYDAFGNSSSTPEQTFITQIDTTQFLAQGWVAYQQQLYISALNFFIEYLQYKPNNLSGLLGLGWTQIRIDSLINKGIATFNNILLDEPNNLDALAGICLGYYRLNNWLMLSIFAENFLGRNMDYNFQYDPKISTYGIRLMLAEAYFNLENYAAADSLLDILYPNNNLDPQDSTTWTINDPAGSIQYDTYLDALYGWILHLEWNYWTNGIPKRVSFLKPKSGREALYKQSPQKRQR